MALPKDELLQVLANIALSGAPRAQHIADEFRYEYRESEFSILNREEDEDFDGDDAYARDVCQRRDGPL